MNLGQNKFYVGLGAVLLVGSLTFGFLLYQASSDFSDAEQKLTSQVAELDRLQKLDLYPEAKNQKVLEDQMASAQDEAVALHQQLVPMAFPLEPITPEQFQDKLNEAVKSLTAKAADAGIDLSDKLYLGFSEYRTATPSPEAAAALGRQLKCIVFAVDAMLDRKVASITKITRTPLPEEQAAARAPSPPPKPGSAKPAAPLFSSYPFEIEFTAEQRAFQFVMNDLSKSAKQFFILRPVTIKNQSEKAPKKIGPTAAADAAAKPEKMRYVLGAEKLNVTLRIDSVVFASNLPK